METKNIVQNLEIPVVIGVSGGVDSMVLLYLAMQQLPRNAIIVAHFDHGLRGADSDGDRIFVETFCHENSLIFEAETKNIAEMARNEKMSIEAAARKYRYQFFAKIYQKYDANALCTAHHCDDRIEGAMFNLIRGTKFGGLIALKNQDFWKIEEQKIHIFRPLLSFSKSEILAFAREKNIPFREDATNDDAEFQRNFLRHEILPKFKQINSEYRRAITNFLEYVSEHKSVQDEEISWWLEAQNSRFKEILQKKFPENPREFSIFSLKDFLNQSEFFQKNIIAYIFEIANYGTIGLSDAIISEILRFLKEGKNSFGMRKIKNLELERRGNWIFWK